MKFESQYFRLLVEQVGSSENTYLFQVESKGKVGQAAELTDVAKAFLMPGAEVIKYEKNADKTRCSIEIQFSNHNGLIVAFSDIGRLITAILANTTVKEREEGE